MALTVYGAPLPLNSTVFGVFEVTFKIPAVIVKVLAIPSIDDADKVNEVPLIATLYKLAVPFNVEVPVKCCSASRCRKSSADVECRGNR